MDQFDGLRKQLRELLESRPLGFQRSLRKSSNSRLFGFVVQWSASFPDLPFKTRVFWAVSGRTEYPRCAVCGKELRYDLPCHQLKGYRTEYCSAKCAHRSPEYFETYRKTMLDRYGVDSPLRVKSVNEKLRRTLSEKTAGEKAKSNEKRRKTNLERYGVEFQGQLPEIAKVISEKQKNLPADVKADIVRRRKATKLERYGDENWTNQEKALETIGRRTDAERRRIGDRIRKTNLERYGVGNVMDVPEIAGKVQERAVARSYGNLLEDEYAEPMFDESFYVAHFNEPLRWRCRRCGKAFVQRKYEHQPYIARCLDCFPLRGRESRLENEVAAYVSGFYAGETIRNSRKVVPPRELDFYFPDVGFAVEFNGVYWHSVGQGCPAGYHVEKTDACGRLGIRLLQVFDFEWRCRRSAVESCLKSGLGLFNRRIPAGSCSVSEIGHEAAREFFDLNSLERCPDSGKFLALSAEDKTVQVLAAVQNGDVLDVVFCAANFTHVENGFGVLLGHTLGLFSGIRRIRLELDRRFPLCLDFQKLGFENVGYGKPRHWFYDSRIKRFVQDKPDTKHPYEVYDCGTVVFEKEM